MRVRDRISPRALLRERSKRVAFGVGHTAAMPGGVILAGLIGAGLIGGLMAGGSALVVGPLAGAAGGAAAVADLRRRAIPNRVVATIVATTAVVAIAVVPFTGVRVLSSLAAGAAVAGGSMLVLHLARPAEVGFGDVKLSAALGALIGVVHWLLAAVMLMVASIVGLAGAGMVRSWRRSLPFGLCLTIGAVTAVLTGRWLYDRLGVVWPGEGAP